MVGQLFNANTYESGSIEHANQHAQVFGTSVDELLGIDSGRRKRGPTPKLQRQIEAIQKLPRTQQRFVMQMLDTVLQQNG